MGRRARDRALRVAVGYAVLAALWILCSDSLVSIIAPSMDAAVRLSIYKGWFFVAATAWLLYLERHRSEARLEAESDALRAAEVRHRAMIEALPDLVFVLDTEHVVHDYWAPNESLLYAPAAVFMGKRLDDVVSPDLAEQWQAAIAEAHRTGHVAYCRYALDLPVGQRRFEARVVPCGDGGTLAVVRDVTLEHNLVEELGEAAKVEALGRMAGDIAHDFNNLLSAVMGYAEFLRESLADDPASLDDVEQILAASRRGAELTGQLLAFSRRQALQATTFDLVDLVDGLRTVLRRLVPSSAQVVFDLPASGSAPVTADHGQVQQALLGLVVSARDAIGPNGTVTVSVRVEGADARLWVDDTGPAIAAEDWPKVFDPFWLRNATGRGSGLAMATIKAVAEQSGGRAEVGQAAGGGNRIGLRLPLAAAGLPAPRTTPPQPGPARAAAGALVLVVEDEPAIRVLSERTLARAGYRVRSAEDGAAALRLVEAEGLAPDGLVTDVVMPEVNGIELARRLRQRQPGLKVLFMSGFTQGHLDLGSEAPADLLVKPFGADELVARVQAMLGRS